MCKVLEVGEFKFFDALYKRYGDPMPLLDQMAASGHLSWFIRSFIDETAIEENDKMLWETWLHKVWNQDWKDFKRETMNRARTYAKNEYIRTHPRETANTIAKSRAIMEQFGKPIEK